MTTLKSRLRCRPFAAAAILATILLSGCGSSAHTSSSPAGAGSSVFPVTVTSAGAAATVPHRPRRIVSLSPSATEDLFAVGAGSQVVAVDSLSTSPKSAPHTNLSAYHPNLEAIAKYRPDLVVIADDINHAGFALDSHPRAFRDVHGDINSIRPFAHHNFAV